MPSSATATTAPARTGGGPQQRWLLRGARRRQPELRAERTATRSTAASTTASATTTTSERRNDSDLRWNGAVSRNVGEGNWIVGLRGRVSYRGNSDYRNDFGVYGNYRLRLDPDNQVAAGLEVRQRRYPTGPLRERTRNIVELSGSWTHALFDGKASFTLAGPGRARVQHPAHRRRCQLLRPVAVDRLQPHRRTSAASSSCWWQNDRYNIERLGAAGDSLVGIGTRNDNLYEVGGGLTWQFAPTWSLNPEILYIRDQSNILAANYSSTEIWITLRKDF